MQYPMGSRKTESEQFKETVERFSSLLVKEGFDIRPYDGDAPSHFLRLPEEMQKSVLDNFSRYAQVCEEVVRAGESPVRGNQFLWRMFQRLGVRPVSDLLAHINDGDVVEIYDSSFIQVFRSLSFFQICSYTLDELLSRPFWELYRRDEALFGRMVDKTKQVLKGEVGGVHEWNVEVHSVDEIHSIARYRGIVQYKLISPLYDAHGNVAAVVNVFRPLSCVSLAVSVPLVSEGSSRHEDV